jgi:hypothetical protein
MSVQRADRTLKIEPCFRALAFVHSVASVDFVSIVARRIGIHPGGIVEPRPLTPQHRPLKLPPQQTNRGLPALLKHKIKPGRISRHARLCPRRKSMAHLPVLGVALMLSWALCRGRGFRFRHHQEPSKNRTRCKDHQPAPYADGKLTDYSFLLLRTLSCLGRVSNARSVNLR